MLIQPGTDLRPFIGNEVRGPDGPVGYGEFNVLEDLQTAARLHSAATGQHWEPVDVAAMDTFGLNTVLMTPLDSLDEDLQFNCNRWSLSWALRNLSGVSQGIYKSVVQSGREFLRIGVAGSTLYKS